MYRVISAILPALVMSVGAATASSIISLPAAEPGASPSVIARGEAQAPAIDAQPMAADAQNSDNDLLKITTSIIAVGADAIPLADDDVASISAPEEPARPAWMDSETPLVIRGGERSDAAPAVAAAAPAEQAPVAPTAAPEAVQD